MSKTSTKALAGIKYVYLVFFFALLAGFFHPIITQTSFDAMIAGTIVLFVGLAGAVLVFKAATSENRRGIFLGGGFGLIAISLYYVLELSNRAIF